MSTNCGALDVGTEIWRIETIAPPPWFETWDVGLHCTAVDAARNPRPRARAGSFAALPFGEYRPRPRRSTIPTEVVDVSQDDLTAISRRLDELIPTAGDPRDVLADLVRDHGPERTAQEARIVFRSLL